MKAARLATIMAATALASACGTAPSVDLSAYDLQPFEYPAEAPVPMVEHPPVEPVEPAEPPVAQPEPPPTRPAPAAPETAPPATPPFTAPPAPAPVIVPEVPSEDHLLVSLVGDLARYSALPVDDVRRELNSATQALTRQRTDANRIRLAMLYTLLRTPQDDARALQLLETIAKSNPASAGVKQLAGVMQVQVNERMRAVREEQQKAEAAIQKLEALRVLERNLMRDRLRSGGGGGGGGSGGGSGGGGR